MEGDEVSFFNKIGRALVRDDCCAGVAIKREYHHTLLYFLNVIK